MLISAHIPGSGPIKALHAEADRSKRPLDSRRRWIIGSWILLATMVLVPVTGEAARVSNIQITKHNLGSSSIITTRDVSTVETDEICVFCHTPHGASTEIISPLWNRTLSAEMNYSPYYSSSINAYDVSGRPQPTEGSKLCLSCHDGTIAIGQVTNKAGSGGYDVAPYAMTIVPAGDKIAPGGGPDPGGSGGTSEDGEYTGFTRRIGTDLSNDHPISFTYDSTSVWIAKDEELETPPKTYLAPVSTSTSSVDKNAIRLPLFVDPADSKAKLQCTTCHDPHLVDDRWGAGISNKFLRLNRFQEVVPEQASGLKPFSTGDASDGDIICLGCHRKDGWNNSAHANSTVATHTYDSAASALREFPNGLPVWKAACLNCHDTHSVAGSRRLLREGVVSGGLGGGGSGFGVYRGGFARAGDYAANSAIEETCYQCHQSSAIVTGTPPDIESEFTGAKKHMPLTQTETGQGTETHDIGNIADWPTELAGSEPANENGAGADFLESPKLLGFATDYKDYRHVECTDCHNPHRLLKNRCFNGNDSMDSTVVGSGEACATDDAGSTFPSPDTSGHHQHTVGAGERHSNIAPGVLRGTWGVEPSWTTSTGNSPWPVMPSLFTIVRGDSGTDEGTQRSKGYVTREYQVCLKCHSNFAYDDNNTFTGSDEGSTSNRPALAWYSGGTPNNTNGLNYFTNQAAELNVDACDMNATDTFCVGGDQGENDNVALSSRNPAEPDQTNHRSWHPVNFPTGRTRGERSNSMSRGMFLAPWDDSIGNFDRIGKQTMYCSDCHGSATPNGSSTPTTPWGPHGSTKDFILKGDWNRCTGGGNDSGTGSCGAEPDDLCFKCHNYSSYTGGGGTSGFGSGSNNFHDDHDDKIDNGIRCMYCHVAVPHGWKNKALLVNLNDIGIEAGCTGSGYQVPNSVLTSTSSGSLSGGVCDGVQYSAGVGFNRAPYYRGAFLKINTWRTSGNWTEGSCGPPSGTSGADWMKNVCEDPNTSP